MMKVRAKLGHGTGFLSHPTSPAPAQGLLPDSHQLPPIPTWWGGASVPDKAKRQKALVGPAWERSTEWMEDMKASSRWAFLPKLRLDIQEMPEIRKHLNKVSSKLSRYI